ncbi:MAG: hypothetical protein QM756_25740 [Polyangiaceae bacterium]
MQHSIAEALVRRVVWLSVACAVACGGSGKSPSVSKDDLSFSATSSKAVYAAGEPIVITLQVANNSSSTLSLSEGLDGTVSLDATRDGVAVKARDMAINFDDDLAVLLSQSLQSVAPRASVELTWQSFDDADQGGQVLRAVEYRADGPHRSHRSLVGAPGDYSLRLRYGYPAALAKAASAYAGELGPAEVSFQVTP